MFILVTVIGMVALFFFSVTINAVVGGVVGWTVDLFFPFITAAFNKITNLNLTGFEWGACLGFVGAFFASSATTKSK